MKRTLTWTIILWVSWLTQGCFTFSLTTKDASIPIEAETVSVQYFQNMARIVEPALSQQLTDDLKDYIQENTRLKLINGAGDLDFEGTITGYDIKPVSITSDEQAAQNRFTITVKVKYTCSVKEDMDYDASFSRYEDFDSSQDFETVKNDMTERIMKLLIEDIYNKAFVNW
ncbi:MAG: LptE family protein [Bacteroidales bacterium]|nr:LptE family protein [Bacteroidales bacterium]MBN2761498.1 LptE family protein [Bacteroidales bacterium]